MSNPIYEARYREVFVSFQEKLSSVFVENGSIIQSETKSSISLWSLLDHQEKFISGIMHCQQDSLQVRGKKDAKEAHLKEALQKYQRILHAVPLPSAPHIFVKGVNPNSARMFKSALYPAVVDFAVDHIDSHEDAVNHGMKPIEAKQAPQALFKVMIKTGDDLRQDQLVVMMIQLMDRLLKRGTLDLW